MGTRKFEGLVKRQYEDVRDTLRTGDLFFAAGNYPLSRMIEHFSGSMFSHVGLLFTWKGRVLLLESVEDDGVRIIPISQYVHDYEGTACGYDGRLFVGRYTGKLNQGKLDALLGAAVDVLNRKYDRDEIGAILARITLGVGHHTDNNAYICSEFVDLCFQAIGIRFEREASGFIFPEHIAADGKVAPVCEIAADEPCERVAAAPPFAPSIA